MVFTSKAIMYAISRENQAYEFTQTLLEYGDINSYVNNTKTTPLMLVAFWRKSKIVQALLKKGLILT